MANEKRVRAFAAGGSLDAAYTAGDTTITSSAFAALPAIDSTQHLDITLNPDGEGAVAPFVKRITAHTAGATTVTVAATPVYGTDANLPIDTYWVHAPTLADFDGSTGGSGLIGLMEYRPGSDTTVATFSNTGALADADGTNLILPIVVPPSGKVLAKLSSLGDATNYSVWGIRISTTDYDKQDSIYATTARAYTQHLITGLTPGASVTLKWGVAVAAGTGHIYCGPGYGSAIMEAWAVNV